MRSVVPLSILVLSVGVVTVALAQPKAVRRYPPPAPAQPAQPVRPVTPVRAAPVESDSQAVARMCESRRAILRQEQDRLDSYRAELAGVDAEMTAIKRRLDQLTRQRDDLSRQVRTSEQQTRTAEDTYKRSCAGNDNCQVYEAQAGDVERQSNALEAQLTNVRADIDSARRGVDTLRPQIEPLRREYNDKRCNNLVPGETSQDVIDRCSAIFSQWNRLQADLNVTMRRLTELRGRYDQLNAELANLDQRAQANASYLAKSCAQSPKLQTVRGTTGVRDRATLLGRELDALINDTTQLRSIRITVTP